MGFIEDFRDLVLEHIPTHPLWAETCAMSILGTVLGRERYIATKKGRLRLNLYAVYIGASSIAHKSLPLNNFVAPLLEMISLDDREAAYLLPDSFSTEGMTSHLAENGGVGIIIRDEMTGLFKESMHKGYLTDEMEYYSKLYDGRPIRRVTRRSGLEYVSGCHISLLAATTPYVYDVMRREFFLQGTGNRIIWLLSDKNSIEPKRHSELTYFRQAYGADTDASLQEMASRLMLLRDGGFTHATVDFDCAKILVDHEFGLQKQISEFFKENPLDLRCSYLGRLHEFVLKLLALKAFSDGWMRYAKTSLAMDEVPVSIEQVKWAIDRVNKHYEYFLEMRAQFTKYRGSKRVQTSRDLFEHVYIPIEHMKEDGMTRSELLRQTQLSSKDMRETIATLMQQKRVVSREIKRGQGRPVTKFYATKFAPEEEE